MKCRIIAGGYAGTVGTLCGDGTYLGRKVFIVSFGGTPKLFYPEEIDFDPMIGTILKIKTLDTAGMVVGTARSRDRLTMQLPSGRIVHVPPDDLEQVK